MPRTLIDRSSTSSSALQPHALSGSLSGWVEGAPGANCMEACLSSSLLCLESELETMNHEVDNEAGMDALLQAFNETPCTWHNTEYIHNDNVPNFASELCPYFNEVRVRTEADAFGIK